MNTQITTLGLRHVRIWGLAILFAFVGCFSLSAQNAVRIREVQTQNSTGLLDEYGNRSAWLELNNVTAGTTNIAGMYLTDDPAKPTKYPIRIGSVKTLIAPHQSFVLFLDGQADKGVFHSGLTLDPSKENTIYLYEGDGVNLVDKVTVPVMEPDQSFAYIITDEKSGKGEYQIVDHPTPNELNSYTHGNENVENFKEQDPIGIVMTLIAIGVVFLGLLLLYLVFGTMGKRFDKRDTEKSPTQKEATKGATAVSHMGKPTEAGVQAAIAMALHDSLHSGTQAAIAMALYESTMRSKQTGMIHLRRDASTSPWANKALTLRRNPSF